MKTLKNAKTGRTLQVEDKACTKELEELGYELCDNSAPTTPTPEVSGESLDGLSQETGDPKAGNSDE